jgi:hypothetical protein
VNSCRLTATVVIIQYQRNILTLINLLKPKTTDSVSSFYIFLAVAVKFTRGNLSIMVRQIFKELAHVRSLASPKSVKIIK